MAIASTSAAEKIFISGSLLIACAWAVAASGNSSSAAKRNLFICEGPPVHP